MGVSSFSISHDYEIKFFFFQIISLENFAAEII